MIDRVREDPMVLSMVSPATRSGTKADQRVVCECLSLGPIFRNFSGVGLSLDGHGTHVSVSAPTQELSLLRLGRKVLEHLLYSLVQTLDVLVGFV